jgi:hypothetical protein
LLGNFEEVLQANVQTITWYDIWYDIFVNCN